MNEENAESASQSGGEEDFVVRIPHPDRLLRSVFPDEAVDHWRAARRESLLAVRALIDAAVENLDKPSGTGSGRARRTIVVE